MIEIVMALALSQMPVPVYATTSPLELYVNADGGLDSNTCGAADPCLSIQGALTHSPQQLRHRVHVNVASGNYGGFTVQGFSAFLDPDAGNGGLLIEGTLSNAVVDAGTATGTVTSATQGSGLTWGTLTDVSQSWALNDLTGHLLVLQDGSNQTRVISSNDAGVISIVGQWTAAPASGAAYAIQDPATHITSGISSLPSPNGPANNQPLRYGHLRQQRVEHTLSDLWRIDRHARVAFL